MKKPQLYFLLSVILIVLILTFFVFKPFLYALVLALIFSSILRPIYNLILAKITAKPGLASFITIIGTTILLLIPICLVGVQFLQEAKDIYNSLENQNQDTFISSIEGRLSVLQDKYPVLQNVNIDLQNFLRQTAGWLASNLGSLFSEFAKLVLSTLIFLISLYYFLKDGGIFKKAVFALSPLDDDNDEAIMRKIKKSMESVLKGTLIVALVQGILASIGFTIFGVPNAILFGMLTAIAALIPGIGTALVVIPAILYLFFYVGTVNAAGMLIWGMVVVGLIDNFIGPRLMGHGTEIHPLFILLAVLGGISLFGPLGFLLGPLVVSLLFALFEILKKQQA